MVGQTSDVISPLSPSTLNYSVQWWAGNIGYRRSQIRVTKELDIGSETAVELQGALTRNIGRASGFDPGDTGEDAGFPGVQARAAVPVRLCNGKKTTFGVSGHYAQEEYDTNVAGRNEDLESWSANGDVAMPVNDWLTVKAEVFHGKNLNTYLGGINQGVDVFATRLTPIHSSGAWVAADLTPVEKWKFTAGASGEAIEAADVKSAFARTANRAIFANAVHEITRNASVGVEVSRWHTKYKHAKNRDSCRVQASFIYSF